MTINYYEDHNMDKLCSVISSNTGISYTTIMKKFPGYVKDLYNGHILRDFYMRGMNVKEISTQTGMRTSIIENIIHDGTNELVEKFLSLKEEI